ncbi:hypothetical protein K4749_38685 [Streptomyces sp. TRM72054]|uniref:terpene synthase family protein n=1 Tax=Streptomyces sp. TRM72054 TaxID=2870562 RepID=UPI001C8B332E|nr:hypothetical protein [Streptomyces sp. TRM72054]MBX9399327.1 hypothetical protein [Streptomyces sp. TRM72054]
MQRLDRTYFSCPFPVRVSPDAQMAREADREWQRKFGLVRTLERASQIEAWRSELLMARTYPECRGEDLILMTNFVNFFFNLDDQFDGPLGRDPNRAREVVQPIIDIAWNSPAISRAHENPAVRGFHNLWQRLSPPMSLDWRMRFAHLLTQYLEMYAWESENRRRNHVPHLQDYIEARRPTSAVGMFIILAERAQRTETPLAIWRASEFQEMFNIAIDHVAWTNDVFALQREESRHDVHNIILSIQQSFSCHREEAIECCRQMVSDHITRFLDLKEHISEVCADLGLSEEERQAVYYLIRNGMESWMSANIDWTFLTQRYKQQGDESLAEQEDIFQNTRAR